MSQKWRFWVGECALAVDDQEPGVASTTCPEQAAITAIPALNTANTIADNRFRSITGPNWFRQAGPMMWHTVSHRINVPGGSGRSAFIGGGAGADDCGGGAGAGACGGGAVGAGACGGGATGAGACGGATGAGARGGTTGPGACGGVAGLNAAKT